MVCLELRQMENESLLRVVTSGDRMRYPNNVRRLPFVVAECMYYTGATVRATMIAASGMFTIGQTSPPTVFVTLDEYTSDNRFVVSVWYS
jgi:hypothetical protein